MPAEVTPDYLMSEPRPHLPRPVVAVLDPLLTHLLRVESHVGDGFLIICIWMVP